MAAQDRRQRRHIEMTDGTPSRRTLVSLDLLVLSHLMYLYGWLRGGGPPLHFI
jgi:hypothetical protein